MSELIKREDVIKITWQEPSYYDPLNVLTEVREKIRALPTVDAAPVIRCKDCKWHVQNGCEYLNLWMMHMDDFFCAFGEVEHDESEE